MSLSELLLFSRRDLLRTACWAPCWRPPASGCRSGSWSRFRRSRIVLASGPEYGLYHQQAQRYKEVLASHGVTLEERITEGAGENYRLLLDRKSGVDIAFVQGGVATFPEANSLVMIASLYYEPLWIFVRRGEPIDALPTLAGKRISMGMPGSGTNALATPLLAASGVNARNATLLRVPTDQAQPALKNGDIDAALMVGGVRTPAIRSALTDPALELVNLAQADAYPQRYSFLTRRTLHAGAIEFAPLMPPRDVALISTEAMLAARDDVHPAIVNLLLEVIRDEHDDQGYFEAPNEFPNVEQVDLQGVARRDPAQALRPEPALSLPAVLGGDLRSSASSSSWCRCWWSWCRCSGSCRRSCAGACARASTAGTASSRCWSTTCVSREGELPIERWLSTSNGSSAASSASPRRRASRAKPTRCASISTSCVARSLPRWRPQKRSLPRVELATDGTCRSRKHDGT